MGGWGCRFPNKVQNSSKSPRKSPLLTRISPFVFPNLTKILGWVGSKIWKSFSKKMVSFFGGSPNVEAGEYLGQD